MEGHVGEQSEHHDHDEDHHDCDADDEKDQIKVINTSGSGSDTVSPPWSRVSKHAKANIGGRRPPASRRDKAILIWEQRFLLFRALPTTLTF